MSVQVELVGQACKRPNVNKLAINKLGAAITDRFDFDQVKPATMDAVDTAFNLFKPVSGEHFIITGMVLTAGFSVSNSASATVDVYESTATDSVVIAKSLYSTLMIRNQVQPLIGLNIEVNDGVYINAKTSDATVSVNLMGFFVPVVP